MSDWPIARIAAPAAGWLDCEVWRIELDAMDPARVPAAALCEFERARAGRLRFVRDADRYRAAHWGLRLVLAEALQLDARAIRLVTDENGKPHLDDDSDGAAAGFSLSHSAGIGVVAVSRSGGVGVDVEQLRPLDDVALLADAHLTTSEQGAWRALESGLRSSGFLTAWTRKEAALKALGIGLQVDPTRVEAGVDVDPAVWYPDADLGGGEVHIRSGIVDGLVLALALHCSGRVH